MKSGFEAHGENTRQLNRDFAVFTKDLLSLSSATAHAAMVCYLDLLEGAISMEEFEFSIKES